MRGSSSTANWGRPGGKRIKATASLINCLAPVFLLNLLDTPRHLLASCRRLHLHRPALDLCLVLRLGFPVRRGSHSRLRTGRGRGVEAEVKVSCCDLPLRLPLREMQRGARG